MSKYSVNPARAQLERDVQDGRMKSQTPSVIWMGQKHDPNRAIPKAILNIFHEGEKLTKDEIQSRLKNVNREMSSNELQNYLRELKKQFLLMNVN